MSANLSQLVWIKVLINKSQLPAVGDAARYSGEHDTTDFTVARSTCGCNRVAVGPWRGLAQAGMAR